MRSRWDRYGSSVAPACRQTGRILVLSEPWRAEKQIVQM
jgi:hypothetical protein